MIFRLDGLVYGNTYMHCVSRIDQAAAQVPAGYQAHSSGFRRATYVDRSVGSVHMGAGICFLERDGGVHSHIHSFEESFYILSGRISLQVGETVHELGAGDFGLIGTGVLHAWRNNSNEPVRWLEMQAPQPRALECGHDTFFPDGTAIGRIAETPASAAIRIGHFDESELPRPGGPSQMEGFNPTAGVAIKMFVDRSFGAVHQSLFLIQYLPGARIDPHDHTFEESYFIVSGHVRAQADGKSYDLGPGDVIWTGVGCIHSFAAIGLEPVRWIETQAPLPPAKEVFRFEHDWIRFERERSQSEMGPR